MKMRRGHLSMRRLLYGAIASIFLVLLGVAGFEVLYRLTVKFAPGILAPKKGLLDYSDTWRRGGLGPGGYLKENFESMVVGERGKPVHWHNNNQGFRNDYEVTPEPPPVRCVYYRSVTRLRLAIAWDRTRLIPSCSNHFSMRKETGKSIKCWFRVSKSPPRAFTISRNLG